MVNLDLLSKNAAALLPVSGVVDTVVVRLGRLLAHKLLEGGNVTAAQLLASEQSEATSHEECDLYLSEFDCDLINNLRSLCSLTALKTRYAALEERLLSLLAQRARRELNTISDDPPLATRLAHEMEAILATSPVRSARCAETEQVQLRSLEALSKRCHDLLLKPHLTWNDVMRADKPLPASELICWASGLANAVVLTSSLMHRLESYFGRDPSEEPGRGSPASYRQLLKNKHKPLHRHNQPLSPTTRPQTRRWEDEAAQLMTDLNFHAFGICVDAVISQLSARLDIWSKNEIHRSAKPKPRLVDVENFFYVDSIRRSLHQLGEGLEDALTCAEKLLQYCQDNSVAATELMDDEIWTLYPKINRENLKQARLRVRHSEHSFPLSVVHREWITQLTDQALAPSV